MAKNKQKFEYSFLIPAAVAVIAIIAVLHLLAYERHHELNSSIRTQLTENHLQNLTVQGSSFIVNFETELLQELYQSILNKKEVHSLFIINSFAGEQYGSIDLKNLPKHYERYDLPILSDGEEVGQIGIIYNLQEQVDAEQNALYFLILSFLLSITISLFSLWFLYRSNIYSQKKQQLKELQHQKAITQQKFALDQHSIVTITDLNFCTRYVNDNYLDKTGFNSKELLGLKSKILNHEESKDNFWENIFQIISEGEVWHGEICNQTKLGKYFWTETTIVPFQDEHNRVESYVFIQTDISNNKKLQKELGLLVTDLEKSKEKLTSAISDIAEQNTTLQSEVNKRREIQDRLNRMAMYDDLTRLPNRTLLKNETKKMIKASTRNKHNCAFMFIDLDGFKAVNDNNGHEIGDTVLVEAAQRLTEVVRAGDIVGRYGGDEFIVLLPDCGTKADIDAIAQRIIDTVQVKYVSVDIDEFVSASVGIAIYPDNAQDFESLFTLADKAMYKAKEAGKNQFTYH